MTDRQVQEHVQNALAPGVTHVEDHISIVP